MIYAGRSHLGLKCGRKGTEHAGVTGFQECAEALANVERSRFFRNRKVINYVGHQNCRLYILFLQSRHFGRKHWEKEAHEHSKCW